ncbi:uncharacterized protein [Halyomorpha halys]|uniref:uncharacterized protein n=1 Tax=Halyomorpha halys TaxID=286706 RepID=UPI0006D5244C|nr:uncharacterized protein LOC106682237 [Halyomorpha halys]
MTINVRKSKTMHIVREQENIEILCIGESIEMVDEYTCLGTVISRNGKVDQEISNRIKKVNVLYYHLCNTVIEKRKVENNVKVHIFKAIHLPTLLYGSESWVPLDKDLSRDTAMEMRYLWKVAGRTRRDRIRNERTIEDVRTVTIDKRQLRWFGHLCRMSEDRYTRKYFQARPSGKRPKGRPRIQCKDYISRVGEKRGKTGMP